MMKIAAFESHRPEGRNSRIAVTTFLLATLAACDGAPWRGADAGGAPAVLQSSEVHVLGTSESIAVVQDLEVLPDGTVWVLNSVEPLFVAFDPEGSVVQMHGRRGGGPEEFGAPAGFVVGGIGGEPWVLDLRRHRLISLSRPDADRSEILLPEEAIPQGSLMGGMNLMSSVVRTARMGNELIVPRRAGQGESDIFGYWLSAWRADLVAVNPETDSVRDVVSLGEVLGDPSPHLELIDISFPLWFRLWAVCSDDEVRVYDRLRNEIRGFRRDGTELAPTPLPPPRYPEMTPAQFARVTFDLAVVEHVGEVRSGISEMTSADSARILATSIAGLNGTPQQLANQLPRYVDFRCAEDGTQWIHPLDTDVGGLNGGPVWLRITTDSKTREVRLPDRFDPYRFTARRIYGVQRDELDVASVAWIEVPRTR